MSINTTSAHCLSTSRDNLPSQPLLMPDHPSGEEIFPDIAAVCLQDPSLAFQGRAVEAASSVLVAAHCDHPQHFSCAVSVWPCMAQLDTGEGLLKGTGQICPLSDLFISIAGKNNCVFSWGRFLSSLWVHCGHCVLDGLSQSRLYSHLAAHAPWHLVRGWYFISPFLVGLSVPDLCTLVTKC